MVNKKTNQKSTKQLSLEDIQEQKEEKFWEEVNQLAQKKIYQLLTRTIPLSNLQLITEHWTFEDRQNKLIGLFLTRDVDYRTLLGDVENQYYQTEDRPNQEYLAEEIALWYCQMAIKSLIADCSNYPAYDPSYFENLTINNEY